MAGTCWNFNMPPKTDEQMSKEWLVSFLNDQHMSIWVGVEH